MGTDRIRDLRRVVVSVAVAVAVALLGRARAAPRASTTPQTSSPASFPIPPDCCSWSMGRAPTRSDGHDRAAPAQRGIPAPAWACGVPGFGRRRSRGKDRPCPLWDVFSTVR